MSSLAKPALRQFSVAELKEATNNFDEALIITRGTFHDVYKGTYFEYIGEYKIQKTVAVKCISLIDIAGPSPSGWLEYATLWFNNSRKVWSNSSHRHMVPMVGYSQESNHPFPNILVYEYMPNGSLANHLCTKSTSSSFSLSWEQCLNIVIDAARGLDYLHSPSSHVGFHHGYLTASNIFLDDINGDVAKISDLYTNIADPMGTSWYLDPESHSDHPIFTMAGFIRSDIYSFGVLLVKVLSRKLSFNEEDENLGIWLHQCIADGTINQMIHPDMKAQIPPHRLKEFLHIAGECLDPCGEKRPTISQVVQKLEFAMAISSSDRQLICHRYSFNEIVEATNNFENIIGEGGEGKVYGGKTKTNIPVAVKLLKPQCFSEFEKEIEMLSTLDHPNLISLVGYCHESDQKVLIYERMQKGNLQTALRGHSLSWEQCLNICIGVARGLQHLHTRTKKSPKGIIHRDMKPSNILLDENFNAKISDFGLSKMSFHGQSTSEIATAFKGTVGYYAPEYLLRRKITRRIDVYAFGVILTEVLCGKMPWDRDESFFPTDDQNNHENYRLWAKENVDPHLEGTISPFCLEAFTDILEKCLNVSPERRPSMNDVVSVLENAQKWQEAWRRNESGVPFYLPGGEDRVVLYYTSNSEEVTSTTQDSIFSRLGNFISRMNSTSSSVKSIGSSYFEDCLRVRLFLRRFKVPIDERDPTKDIYTKEFKQVSERLGKGLPKVFIRGNYVGGLEILDKTEELAKLLGVPCPKFICRSCGEAKSCNVCEWEEWYVLCRNCDALTIVSKEWKGDMKCCLQCNGNQLIFQSNLETVMPA